MPDREELMYQIARALNESRDATELQEAADQERAVPWVAAEYHRRAADRLVRVLGPLQALINAHAHKAQS